MPSGAVRFSRRTSEHSPPILGKPSIGLPTYEEVQGQGPMRHRRAAAAVLELSRRDLGETLVSRAACTHCCPALRPLTWRRHENRARWHAAYLHGARDAPRAEERWSAPGVGRRKQLKRPRKPAADAGLRARVKPVSPPRTGSGFMCGLGEPSSRVGRRAWSGSTCRAKRCFVGVYLASDSRARNHAASRRIAFVPQHFVHCSAPAVLAFSVPLAGASASFSAPHQLDKRSLSR